MTNKKASMRLQNSIGKVIQCVFVEFMDVDAQASSPLISVGVIFIDGPTVLLFCSGDGRVGFRISQLNKTVDAVEVRSIAVFEGDTLESVQVHEGSIVLATTKHHLSVLNVDDELNVLVDDCPFECAPMA